LKTRTSISQEDKNKKEASFDGKRQNKQISPITPKRMLNMGKNQKKTPKSPAQNPKRKEIPLSTVASRLEERRNKKLRKEQLHHNKENNGATIDIKPPFGATVDINPPSGNAIEFDEEIIEYDLPTIVGVPVSSVMRNEMEIGKSDKYLFFETKDNDGKGNCFYTSILNSNAFSPAATIDDDVDTLLAMREELQQFAIENEQLSNFIFDREVDCWEHKEWAGKLLVLSIDNPEKGDFLWIIEKLKKDEIFSEAAGNTTTEKSNAGDPRVVMKTLGIQCKEDATYTKGLIEKHFTNNEIKNMAKQWWLKSIGTGFEWAGRPEMLLFSLKYQKHLMILSNRLDGPQVDGTYSAIESMRSDINGLVQIPERSTYRDSIFLWAINPHNPLAPLEICDQTQHYVTLNIIRNKKLLTKKKKSQAFYFEASLEDKKKKQKK
jgi:hypothetical protein